jgi:hypothetical protein
MQTFGDQIVQKACHSQFFQIGFQPSGPVEKVKRGTSEAEAKPERIGIPRRFGWKTIFLRQVPYSKSESDQFQHVRHLVFASTHLILLVWKGNRIPISGLNLDED